jgi:hypothetical protein
LFSLQSNQRSGTLRGTAREKTVCVRVLGFRNFLGLFCFVYYAFQFVRPIASLKLYQVMMDHARI